MAKKEMIVSSEGLEKLKQEAESDDRSLSQHINRILKQHINEKEAHS